MERCLPISQNNIKILEPLTVNRKKSHPMKLLGFGNSRRDAMERAELGHWMLLSFKPVPEYSEGLWCKGCFPVQVGREKKILVSRLVGLNSS